MHKIKHVLVGSDYVVIVICYSNVCVCYLFAM